MDFSQREYEVASVVGLRLKPGVDELEYLIRWKDDVVETHDINHYLDQNTINGLYVRHFAAGIEEVGDKGWHRIHWKDTWLPESACVNCQQAVRNFWARRGLNYPTDMIEQILNANSQRPDRKKKSFSIPKASH
ncbi:hypothetical protein CBER1_09958 [Cercospora berteroae]|uniref:Chromo domain-containing protein n=1 Tax=Cercospora berteroae TaxID=357750 RepID=A0A2S6C5X8_9PEZI|nr:hypothetical protein CBER1_09958 [Cercospora berteroae]